MIHVQRYTPDRKESWDRFVAGSKNGTFLFLRDYMDYHADRFHDHSLLFYDDKERLTALLPGNESYALPEAENVSPGSGKIGRPSVYFSHQGLSYGGFILSLRTRAVEVLRLFDSLLDYLRTNRFETLHYKQIPVIYHRAPSQEEDYALWRCGAVVESCNISCAVQLHGGCLPEVERRRRRGYKNALSAGFRILEDAPLADFWPIMLDNLRTRYNAAPVHSLEEMQLLQGRFPQYISCYLAVHETEGRTVPEAGAVVYETPQTVHVQYGHATPAGKAAGALDLLYLTLIEKYARDARYLYFDFGTSNEQGGRYLNENLIAQKEGFGGRGIACRTFKIDLSL